MTTVLESLNAGLHRAFAADERVYLLGEDVLDPYGGAFKVTRGLSSAFPGRVLTTPISEAGITGAAAGMALRGLRPVVEIMFGDFITLAADQLINHAAKFRWMYNDRVRVPLVLRTPMGGRRGYGPTHSQTLEKLLMGIPGLRIASPTALGDPGSLLEKLILKGEDPTLFVENKLLYALPVLDSSSLGEFELQELFLSLAEAPALPETGGEWERAGLPSPTYRLTLRGAPAPGLTIATYGYMAEPVRQAALRLAYECEIFTELIVPTLLAPFKAGPILTSAARTGRLLVVEEGAYSLGWGAEILARAAEILGPRLQAVRRLAAADLPVPASGPLEAAVLPDVEEIVQAGQSMV
jgi:pyruvate/2-oxoglutarate/acetoin dehydrogenase E1 component